MAESTVVAEEQTQIIAPIDQVLPPGPLFVYGLQHVLAMYAGAVAVPLVVGGALKLSQEQLIFLISADLFTCSIATLIQILGLGRIPIGIKIPLIQGCTFAAVTPMILTGGAHGLTAIYGAIIVTECALLPVSSNSL